MTDPRPALAALTDAEATALITAAHSWATLSTDEAEQPADGPDPLLLTALTKLTRTETTMTIPADAQFWCTCGTPDAGARRCTQCIPDAPYDAGDAPTPAAHLPANTRRELEAERDDLRIELAETRRQRDEALAEAARLKALLDNTAPGLGSAAPRATAA